MIKSVKAAQRPYRRISELRDGEGCSVALSDDLIFYDSLTHEIVLEDVPIPDTENYMNLNIAYIYLEQTSDGFFGYVGMEFGQELSEAMAEKDGDKPINPFLIDGIQLVSTDSDVKYVPIQIP